MSAAFVVEGETEVAILQKMCGYKMSIRKFEMNGKRVNARKVAEKIQFFYKLDNNKSYPLIFILDVEKRNETADEYQNLIENEFSSLSIPKDQVKLYLADRNLESWLAPFIDDKGNDITKPVLPNLFEGKLTGNNYLKNSISNYDKITMGGRIFKNLDKSYLATISPSFKSLYRGLSPLCPQLLKASS
jgi:hypothetical protein